MCLRFAFSSLQTTALDGYLRTWWYYNLVILEHSNRLPRCVFLIHWKNAFSANSVHLVSSTEFWNFSSTGTCPANVCRPRVLQFRNHFHSSSIQELGYTEPVYRVASESGTVSSSWALLEANGHQTLEFGSTVGFYWVLLDSVRFYWILLSAGARTHLRPIYGKIFSNCARKLREYRR